MQGNDPIAEVTEVARAVASGDFERGVSLDIKGELGDLVVHLERIRKNLQTLPGIQKSTERAPELMDGLQSISRASEEGTHRVLALSEDLLEDRDEVETIIGTLRTDAGNDLQPSVDRLETLNAKARNQLLELLTALSFQDLTGQKIKMLEETFTEIQGRVLKLLIAFGIACRRATAKDAAEVEAFEEKMGGHIQSLVKGDLDQNLVDDIMSQING